MRYISNPVKHSLVLLYFFITYRYEQERRLACRSIVKKVQLNSNILPKLNIISLELNRGIEVKLIRISKDFFGSIICIQAVSSLYKSKGIMYFFA